jgi:hypothetical protein
MYVTSLLNMYKMVTNNCDISVKAMQRRRGAHGMSKNRQRAENRTTDP